MKIFEDRKSEREEVLKVAMFFLVFAIISLIPMFYINRTLYVLILSVVILLLAILLYGFLISLVH